jgi:GNAT superfamily N-acetyltransferase
MLLPELRDLALSFVAVNGQHQLVVGAAAAARAYRQHPLPGPGIAIRVIEPCRRRGIGTNLLQHLMRTVHAHGAKALYAANRVPLETPEMQAWKSLGFIPCETVEEHTLPLAEFEPRLAPLLQRMRAQGKIPLGARIIPLYRANLPAVLQLHLDSLGGDRGELYRKLRSEGPRAFHPRYSRVLTINDQVKGCILAHRTGQETAAVDANIVDPGLRGGWANVWLKLEATRGALSLGIKTFEFTTFDHYADTRRFADKLGGTTIRTTALMYRPLE